jgi:flagellar hook-associated protein 3 FlgL
LDEAFDAFFTFYPDDPPAANITAEKMNEFIDKYMAESLPTDWTKWSNATDQPIISRISLNETAETSVSANSAGTQKLLIAAAMVSHFMPGNLSAAAKGALVDKASGLVSDALTDSAAQQADLGLTQNKVSNATDRIKSQVDLFQRNLQDLEGVDPYEASTRITSLLGQLEASYSLTARMQQLSLVNFLK